ncbi:MAG: MurR/RpiR family transcriptional regulator [Devosia sp.]
MAQLTETTEAFRGIVDAAMPQLTASEQRMARFFAANMHAVLLESAAQIAERAASSDATVVRTAKALGFDGLLALREAILADLSGGISPAERLKRTLSSSGSEAGRILSHVVAAHDDGLTALRSEDFEQTFTRAVSLLASSRRRHVFGLGPSGSIAGYATLQFNRIGFDSRALDRAGIALADQLMEMGPGDAVLLFAYAPIYKEVAVVLEQAAQLGLPVILVSDSMGPLVSEQISEILPVPRGKSAHLAMHGATMVLVDALIAALAATQQADALSTLLRLASLRADLDPAWAGRGVRRATKPPVKPKDKSQ